MHSGIKEAPAETGAKKSDQIEREIQISGGNVLDLETTNQQKSVLRLRPYQEECLQSILKSFQKGINRQLCSLPTGSGKTVIFSHLARATDFRTLVIAHTTELLDQAKEKIEMICPGLEVGIVNGDSKQFDAQIVISSIQALYRPQNLSALVARNFDLLIYDEAHRSAAEMSRQVINELGFGKGTKRLLVGFSATPIRQDGRGLGEVFDEVVFERSTKWMIDQGYLCKPKGFKVATDLDLSSIKSADGDYQASSLADMMDTPELIKLVVDAYRTHAQDLPAICFTTSIQHAENVAAAFRQAGIPSASISGESPREERASLINQFKKGDITILANCQVLTEGFDAPETACVIVARPTKSQALYQQMLGRGLRLFPNKRECIVLDFCDKAHTLCTTAMLLGDAEYLSDQEGEEETRKKEMLGKLPPNLNKKLKAAIISFDPLGEHFIWQKDGSAYVLKGGGSTRLEIVSSGHEKYSVSFTTNPEGNKQVIAEQVSFEYAFAAAEAFAKANRALFIVSDKEAAWRDLPISEKQINCFRSYGYRAGIEHLTRGQAADLISSGCLRRAS